MRATPTRLPDVRLLRPEVHADARGWLVESFRAETLAALGLPVQFPQENLAWSQPGVLRGLHHQERQAQGKLVQVLVGAIWDVAVDLRADSPTRGRWVAQELCAERVEALWVPPGFAHGFYVTGGPALVQYKLTAPYAPEWDRCLAWDDPTLAIPWPLDGPPLLSERDQRGRAWAQTPPWSPDPSLPGATLAGPERA